MSLLFGVIILCYIWTVVNNMVGVVYSIVSAVLKVVIIDRAIWSIVRNITGGVL